MLDFAALRGYRAMPAVSGLIDTTLGKRKMIGTGDKTLDLITTPVRYPLSVAKTTLDYQIGNLKKIVDFLI